MTGVRRVAQVIRLKPDGRASYIELHGEPWPEILADLSRMNITNYSIYIRDDLLFSYYEYRGSDLEADVAASSSSAATQAWLNEVMPLMKPMEDHAPGEWWSPMEEIFHLD